MLAQFRRIRPFMFVRHSGRYGPTSRVWDSINSSKVTQAYTPRNLLERNCWLFLTTFSNLDSNAFGTKERKFLSKRLRYQRKAMAIIYAGDGERISESSRYPSNRVKSRCGDNLKKYIQTGFCSSTVEVCVVSAASQNYIVPWRQLDTTEQWYIIARLVVGLLYSACRPVLLERCKTGDLSKSDSDFSSQWDLKSSTEFYLVFK
jgi:hypothetical protein